MEKLKRKKHSKNGYPYIILGILLLITSSYLLIEKKLIQNEILIKEEKSIEKYFKEVVPDKNNVVNVQRENKEKSVINYIGVIEIPAINLKRGLVDINDERNNIEYNIEILKESNFPDEKFGNFILASHSGNSNVSFFKNIYKLKLDDLIIIYYKNKIYNYKIYKKYEIEKNGKTTLELDNKNTYITLITCIPNTNKQLVILGKME